MTIWEQLPAFKEAVLMMANDNGAIHRGHSVEQHLTDCEEVIFADGVDFADLQRLNDWLANLSDDEVLTVVAGEESEMEAICAHAPKHREGYPLTNIFNDIFEMESSE